MRCQFVRLTELMCQNFKMLTKSQSVYIYMCVCVFYFYDFYGRLLFLISQLIIIIIIILLLLLLFGVEGQIGKETKDSGESQLGPAHISETLDTAIKTKHKYQGSSSLVFISEREHTKRENAGWSWCSFSDPRSLCQALQEEGLHCPHHLPEDLQGR